MYVDPLWLVKTFNFLSFTLVRNTLECGQSHDLRRNQKIMRMLYINHQNFIGTQNNEIIIFETLRNVFDHKKYALTHTVPQLKPLIRKVAKCL